MKYCLKRKEQLEVVKLENDLEQIRSADEG